MNVIARSKHRRYRIIAITVIALLIPFSFVLESGELKRFGLDLSWSSDVTVTRETSVNTRNATSDKNQHDSSSSWRGNGKGLGIDNGNGNGNGTNISHNSSDIGDKKDYLTLGDKNDSGILPSNNYSDDDKQVNLTRRFDDSAEAKVNTKTKTISIVNTKTNTKPVLTILVMLSGEFGNNMFKIIRGWGVSRLAEQEFGLKTRLVFSQQRIRGKGKVIQKAIKTAKELERCFVVAPPLLFRADEFRLGNRLLHEKYFREIHEIPGSNFTLSDGSSTIQDLRDNLKMLSDHLSNHRELIADDENLRNAAIENGSIVPRLMVRVDSLKVYSVVNEFYDDIRKTFVFNEQQCCGETLNQPPNFDETVLHLRNYATEIRKQRIRLAHGFEELDSERLSSEVLGHLKGGDKIALAGRNLKSDAKKNSTEVYRIVSALEAKNLTVRYTPGTSGAEDFCFLTRTKKELIGTPVSTYLELAAFLAGPSLELTRLYQYVPSQVSEGYGSKLESFRKSVGANWTNPELRSRIRFEEYF